MTLVAAAGIPLVRGAAAAGSAAAATMPGSAASGTVGGLAAGIHRAGWPGDATSSGGYGNGYAGGYPGGAFGGYGTGTSDGYGGFGGWYLGGGYPGGAAGGYAGGAGGYAGGSGSGSAGGYPGGSAGGYGDGASGGNSSGGASAGAAQGTGGAPTTAESSGVVLIGTEIDGGGAEAAGTGMVLTSGGEILTNNHVIAGATAIEVEVVSTGAVYAAHVVGADATDDVAVLQVQGAPSLTTAKFGSSSDVQVGEAVTGVGNAEGGGQLVAAPGQVTGLDQSITTQAEQLEASESLSGLIETDDAIEPGDSGGPLYDGSGAIVGMDTAASDGGVADSYAIPISQALRIAHTLAAGGTAGAATAPTALGIPGALDVA